MNKISIITITYNNLKGLKKTVQSVFDQKYSNIEFIIIDGGSEDTTAQYLQENTNKITYWVSEPDKGIYNAMNKGLSVASGNYVHFLNAGDGYASSDVLSIFFEKEQNIPFIRGTQICNYGDRTQIWENLGDKRVTLYDMYINTMLHQATFIRRDLFEKYGLYDESLKITSDWKFFFQAILGGEDTIFYNIPVVDFEMYGISTVSGKYGTILKRERKQVLENLMPENLLPDYQRFFEMEKGKYISDFISSNKFFLFVFKAFRKICLAIGVGK